MPRSATAQRCWPAAPRGGRDALVAVAAELADEHQRAVAVAELERLSVVLIQDLDRHAAAPGRREASMQLRRLRDAARAAAAAARNLHPLLGVVFHSSFGASKWRGDLEADLDTLADSADGALADLGLCEIERPGPGNLADAIYGSPRFTLCCAAVRLVTHFRGAAACVSTPGGLVYRIAAAIWQHATDEDPEAFALDRYLRAAVSSARGAPPAMLAR